MVTFSFIKPPARGSLRRRRMADALRRLTAALCVGLAVLFGIEAVLAVVETEPMVVAARSIRRGDIILAADVQLADMPVSAAGPSWTGNIEDVVGKVAQIDIEAADPISTHMARDAPVAPTGTTVIEVRLASSVDDVLAGDQVRLVSAVGCEGADCTLAENATVMNVGKPDATGALGGNDRLVSFAMPPEAAAKVMELQQAGAIMAVVRPNSYSRSLKTAQCGGSSPRMRLSSSDCRCWSVCMSPGSSLTPSASNCSVPFITTRLCLRGVRRVAEYSAMVIQPRDRSHRYG